MHVNTVPFHPLPTSFAPLTVFILMRTVYLVIYLLPFLRTCLVTYFGSDIFLKDIAYMLSDPSG